MSLKRIALGVAIGLVVLVVLLGANAIAPGGFSCQLALAADGPPDSIPGGGRGRASAPAFDPIEVKITGHPGDVLGRTAIVRPDGAPLEDVEFLAQDLIAAETAIGADVAIPAGKVAVVPDEITSVSSPFTLSVTVSTDASQRAGVYEGDVVMLADGVEALRLHLVVTLVDRPELAFDEAAVTIQASRCSGGEGAVSLRNNGLGTATELDVSAGAFQAEGRSLPAGALAATLKDPAKTDAPPGETTIKLDVNGSDSLAPGKYLGSVAVRAKGIKPMTKAVAVNVKASVGVAVLTLAAGLALGWLFVAWSSKLAPRLGQADTIVDLYARVRAPESRLMEIDGRRAKQAIDQAALLFNTDAPTTDVAAALERVTAILTAAQTSYFATSTTLETLFTAADYENDVLKPLVAERAALADRIEARLFRSWDEATAAVEALRAKVARWRTDPPPPAVYAALLVDADAAAAAARQLAPPPDDQATLVKQRLVSLKSVRTLVTVLSFVVLVFVGYVTLYAANATFGASVGDYVNLFLFGSVVEGLWGKNVKLSDLKVKPPGQ